MELVLAPVYPTCRSLIATIKLLYLIVNNYQRWCRHPSPLPSRTHRGQAPASTTPRAVVRQLRIHTSIFLIEDLDSGQNIRAWICS